jgi:hypothetical protein
VLNSSVKFPQNRHYEFDNFSFRGKCLATVPRPVWPLQFGQVIPCPEAALDLTWGMMSSGEANPEAPAQAELRPTCAGASRVNLHLILTACALDTSEAEEQTILRGALY